MDLHSELRRLVQAQPEPIMIPKFLHSKDSRSLEFSTLDLCRSSINSFKTEITDFWILRESMDMGIVAENDS